MREPSRFPFFYGWVIVFVAAMLGFLGTGFFSYARGVFLPHLTQAYGTGTLNVAWGFSASGVVGAAIAPWLGRLLDRISPRRVLLFGIVVVSLGYWLLSFTSVLWQFYIVVGLFMGIGMSCMGNFTWHRILVSWFEQRRGLALSLAVAGASVAGIAMPFFATWMVETFGWQRALFVFGIVTATVLLPLVFVFMRDTPAAIGEVIDGHASVSAAQHGADPIGAARDEHLWRLRELLRTPAFWAVALVFGVMQCIFSVVMLHLYKHALNIGLSNYQAATVAAAVALCSFLGKPVIGWICDAWGGRVALWLALALHALGLAALAYAQGLWIAVGAAGLYGFGLAGMSPLRAFAIAASFGKRSFPVVNGYLRPVQLPFELTASPFAGFIYDTFGSYQKAFLILVGIVLVGMLGPFFISAGGARERAARIAAAKAQGREPNPLSSRPTPTLEGQP